MLEKRIYSVKATFNRWENDNFHQKLIEEGLTYISAFGSWKEMEEHLQLTNKAFVISLNDRSFVRTLKAQKNYIEKEEFLAILQTFSLSKKFGL
jgi:uncharacterized protein (DUF1919 family)